MAVKKRATRKKVSAKKKSSTRKPAAKKKVTKRAVKRRVTKKRVTSKKAATKKRAVKKAPAAKAAAKPAKVSADLKKAVTDVVKARSVAHKTYDQARQDMGKAIKKEVTYLTRQVNQAKRSLASLNKKAAVALGKSKRAKPGTTAKEAAVVLRSQILAEKASVAADLAHLKAALAESRAAEKANDLYMKGVAKLHKDITKKLTTKPKRKRRTSKK